MLIQMVIVYPRQLQLRARPLAQLPNAATERTVLVSIGAGLVRIMAGWGDGCKLLDLVTHPDMPVFFLDFSDFNFTQLRCVG